MRVTVIIPRLRPSSFIDFRLYVRVSAINLIYLTPLHTASSYHHSHFFWSPYFHSSLVLFSSAASYGSIDGPCMWWWFSPVHTSIMSALPRRLLKALTRRLGTSLKSRRSPSTVSNRYAQKPDCVPSLTLWWGSQSHCYERMHRTPRILSRRHRHQQYSVQRRGNFMFMPRSGGRVHGKVHMDSQGGSWIGWP